MSQIAKSCWLLNNNYQSKQLKTKKEMKEIT